MFRGLPFGQAIRGFGPCFASDIPLLSLTLTNAYGPARRRTSARLCNKGGATVGCYSHGAARAKNR